MGIKSCVFVTAGTYLGICFAQQMCDLSDFRNRNHLIRQELFLKSQEEEKLRVEAYEDRLTGCYTRLYAEKTCFPSASNPIAFPCANGIFTATLKERITHYTLKIKKDKKRLVFCLFNILPHYHISIFWCEAKVQPQVKLQFLKSKISCHFSVYSI